MGGTQLILAGRKLIFLKTYKSF